MCEHLTPLSKTIGVRVVPVVGGLAPAKQLRLLSKQPAVVVATPGRLWELMSSGEPHLTDLSALSFLVLDEADRMVQAGHFQVSSRITEACSAEVAHKYAMGWNSRLAIPGWLSAMRHGFSVVSLWCMSCLLANGCLPFNEAPALHHAPLHPDKVNQLQELSSILEHIPGMQQRGRSFQVNAKHSKARDVNEATKDPGIPHLQVFVFSATLTLPHALRKRLKKGVHNAAALCAAICRVLSQ